VLDKNYVLRLSYHGSLEAGIRGRNHSIVYGSSRLSRLALQKKNQMRQYIRRLVWSFPPAPRWNGKSGDSILINQSKNQETVHVKYNEKLADLMRKGKDLEKIVLSRAVWQHLEHKVMVYGNKTVVFK